MPRRQPALMTCLLILLASAWVAARQDSVESDPPRPLIELHFDGLQRYAHDDIVRFTGLQIGQPITEARLTSLAQQLADSGLFTGIRYQYTTTEKGLVARFTVSEPQWTIPVVFDNFIGISDEELIAAVARYVPAFDGTAVADGATNNLIGTALQHVLADLDRPGRIVVIPRVNVEQNWTRYAFAVTETGRDMSICAIDVPGATGGHREALHKALAGLLGEPYSRSALQILLNGSLLDYYRNRGYWGATFGEPQAALDEGCTGVSVALPVTEGVVYRTAGIRWEGNVALSDVQLDSAMDLAPGAVATRVQIEDGLLNVRNAYERIGRLLEEHTLEPELDQAAGTVIFVVRIDEGPELRMGRLTIEGLPPAAVADLGQRWQLAQGAVFDGTYVQRFMNEHQALIQRDDGPFMTVDVTVDRTASLAHVTIRPAQ
jgi:outer membrane protein assembly factor BamA